MCQAHELGYDNTSVLDTEATIGIHTHSFNKYSLTTQLCAPRVTHSFIHTFIYSFIKFMTPTLGSGLDAQAATMNHAGICPFIDKCSLSIYYVWNRMTHSFTQQIFIGSLFPVRPVPSAGDSVVNRQTRSLPSKHLAESSLWSGI